MSHVPKCSFEHYIHSRVENAEAVAVARAYRSYREAKDNVPDLEAFVQSWMPNDELLSLESILLSYTNESDALERARKLLVSNGYCVKDTLSGYQIDMKAAEYLAHELNKIEVKPVFSQYISRFDIDSEVAAYSNFLAFARSRGLERIPYHPLGRNLAVWPGEVDSLRKTIEDWSMEYFADKEPHDSSVASIKDAAESLGVSSAVLCEWLRCHPESYVHDGGYYFVPKTFLYELMDKMARLEPVDRFITPIAHEYPRIRRAWIRTYMERALLEADPSLVEAPGTFPGQKYPCVVRESPQLAKFLDAIKKSVPQICLTDLCDVTGFKRAGLEKCVQEGIIDATRFGSNYYISMREQQRIISLCEEYTSLDALVDDIVAHNQDIHWKWVTRNVQNLQEYLYSFDLWDDICLDAAPFPIAARYTGRVLEKSEVPAVVCCITPWLLCQGRTHDECVEVLMNRYKSRFPDTVSELQRYIRGHRTEVDAVLVSMLRCLFIYLPGDLPELSEREIAKSVISAACDYQDECYSRLVRFLEYSGYIKGSYQKDKTPVKQDCSAYDEETFYTLVAVTLGQTEWKSRGLIDKAFENPNYSDLWLFTALNLTNAVRTTDLTQLESPNLPYTPNETKRKILSNEYTEADAIYVTCSFEHCNEVYRPTPNKTRTRRTTSGSARTNYNCPPLHLSIPTSLRYELGVILSIATVHYLVSGGQGAFVKDVKDSKSIRSFFGDDVANMLGIKGFTPRKAIKSLMQAVEQQAILDGKSGDTAYFLASFMRSHTAHFKEKPKATEIYLRDGKFSGFSANYAVQQIFERGVCSFMVDDLLAKCYGDEYKTLPEPVKTSAIRSLGLTVSDRCSIMSLARKAQVTAHEIVYSLSIESANKASRENKSVRDVQKNAICNLITGNAYGKSMSDMCLCTALELECKDPARSNCFGCPYEIKTAALLCRYGVNARRVKSIIRDPDATVTDKAKSRYTLMELIQPSVLEIFANLTSGSEDVASAYTRLFEEIMNDQ